jgi:oxygen-independent coproporphyrinogen-3 oxidase
MMVAEEKQAWGILKGVRPTKIPMKLLEQGKSDEEIHRYMTETYEVSHDKIKLSLEIAKREQEILARIAEANQGYSLYIGIPFCPSKCLYCSFVSNPIDQWQGRVEEYLQALEKEISLTASLCKDKKLNTIYIGGGTPTTLSTSQLERLFKAIEHSFDCSHVLEYTVEAGRPDSIDESKLSAIKAHGISRISINPQSMVQKTLDLIGRRHSVDQTIEAFHLARDLGFANINMDLIAGLPEEGIQEITHSLEQVKELRPDSLTIHSLAIKRGSPLMERKEEFTPQNSTAIMDLTEGYAREMGLLPYYLYRLKNSSGNLENVGYATPGKEGIYNILIMEEKQSILALGAGAVSKYVSADGHIDRMDNVKDIDHYIGRIGEMLDRKKKGMTLWH